MNLQEQLDKAIATGDINAIAKIAGMMSRQARQDQAEKDKAIQAELDSIKPDIQASIVKAVEPHIKAGNLDNAHGIYFTWTFGNDPDLKLNKPNNHPSKRVRRHPEISTSTLICLYGDLPYPDIPGTTYKDQYLQHLEHNFRYPKIRKPLLARYFKAKKK